MTIKKNTKWSTIEKLHAEALKYATITEFKKGHYGAYSTAKKKGWLKAITEHMRVEEEVVDVPDGHKQCYTCKETKPLDRFSKNMANADGKCIRCKACDKIYNDKWRERNNKRSNHYRDKIKAENPERLREYNRNHYNKMKESQLHPLRASMTTLIRLAIRDKRYSPFKRTAFILGCNCEDFIAYIESKFAEGMNWDNRDEWHIDHIIPQSYATTIEDVYILNHHTNLQPLWIRDNVEKYKSVTEDVAEKFLELKERNIFLKTLLKY